MRLQEGIGGNKAEVLRLGSVVHGTEGTVRYDKGQTRHDQRDKIKNRMLELWWASRGNTAMAVSKQGRGGFLIELGGVTKQNKIRTMDTRRANIGRGGTLRYKQRWAKATGRMARGRGRQKRQTEWQRDRMDRGG